jgi:hypothetical protein
MDERSTRVPEWFVERLAADDLDAAVAERIHARLLEWGELGRLRRIEESNRAILQAHPTSLVVPKIERRLAELRTKPVPSSARLWAWPSIVVGLPTLALVMLMTLAPEIWQQAPTSPAPTAEERGPCSEGE